MSKVENQLKKEIDEMLRQKAESSSDEPSDSDHGYADALIWLKEGSIQLTNEDIKKELKEQTYADKDASNEYCKGYDSALKQVLKKSE
jgi:ABC-type Zn2+ transport system substrate-binding protein/surface adhesin